MMTHAKRQMEEARTKILNGEAGALPYKRGQESGCAYCPYRHVCGFDVKIPGYEYRDIGTMGKEEAMAEMRIEQRESEDDRKGETRYGCEMDRRTAESHFTSGSEYSGQCCSRLRKNGCACTENLKQDHGYRKTSGH